MTHLASLSKQWYVNIFSNVLKNNGILVCVFNDAWVDRRQWVQIRPPFFSLKSFHSSLSSGACWMCLKNDTVDWSFLPKDVTFFSNACWKRVNIGAVGQPFLPQRHHSLFWCVLKVCQYWCNWSILPSPKASPSLLKENQPTLALKNPFFLNPL